jgi:hypothetical protein
MSKSRSRTHSADIDQNQVYNPKKNYMHVPKNENKIVNKNFSNNNYIKNHNDNNITNSLNKNYAKVPYSSNSYRDNRNDNVSSNSKGRIRTSL